jgi:hypothetical protein
MIQIKIKRKRLTITSFGQTNSVPWPQQTSSSTPPPSPSTQPATSNVTALTNHRSKNLLPIEEFQRRNKIITDLAAACPYKVHDLVRPVKDDKYAKEGLYRVTNICQNWTDYKGSSTDENKVEWSDNPYIIHVWQLNSKESIVGTMNYFKKFEEEKVQSC